MIEFSTKDPSELPPDRWARMGLTLKGTRKCGR